MLHTGKNKPMKIKNSIYLYNPYFTDRGEHMLFLLLITQISGRIYDKVNFWKRK